VLVLQDQYLFGLGESFMNYTRGLALNDFLLLFGYNNPGKGITIQFGRNIVSQ